MSVPAPTILRIHDSREDRPGAKLEKCRLLKCQTGEVCALLGVFSGMLSFAFFSVIISFQVAWDLILIWVSVIFGLLLRYCSSIYFFRESLYIFLHAMNH